jgi:hypothetical protein
LGFLELKSNIVFNNFSPNSLKPLFLDQKGGALPLLSQYLKPFIYLKSLLTWSDKVPRKVPVWLFWIGKFKTQRFNIWIEEPYGKYL